MRNFSRFILSLSLFVPAILLGSAEAQEQVRFRMEWVPSGIYSGFYFARQSGQYEKAGLAVEILPGSGSNFTVDAVQRG